MPKLNSCPWCGSDHINFVTIRKSAIKDLFTLRCENCHSETPEFNSGVESIHFWNKEFPNIVRESEMTNEYLEGPDLYRAIADAIDAGENPEVFQILGPHKSIGKANTWNRLIEYNEKFGYKIRRKPKVRSFTDENGTTWTWPEPVNKRLEAGEHYFFIDLASRVDGIGEDTWGCRAIDDIRLVNGLIQRYREASEQQLDALLAVL